MQRAILPILILALLLGTPFTLAFPPCCAVEATTGQTTPVSADAPPVPCCPTEAPGEPDPQSPTTPTHPDNHPRPGDCNCPPLCCASVPMPAMSRESAPPHTATPRGGPLNPARVEWTGRLATLDLTRPPRG